MATAAELKARLLKHVKPVTTTVVTGVAPVVPATESSIRPAPAAATEQTTLPAAQPVASSTAGSDGQLSGRQESRDVDVTNQSHELVVSTEVQSTDVVIVERPPAMEVETAERESEESMESGTNLDITNPIHQGFLQRLADLETALLERDPLMKTHLGAIHKTMMEYEEIANLLRPEEIAKIMAAQQAHTGMILRVETLSKSKAATNKKAAQLGLNDV